MDNFKDQFFKKWKPEWLKIEFIVFPAILKCVTWSHIKQSSIQNVCGVLGIESNHPNYFETILPPIREIMDQ